MALRLAAGVVVFLLALEGGQSIGDDEVMRVTEEDYQNGVQRIDNAERLVKTCDSGSTPIITFMLKYILSGARARWMFMMKSTPHLDHNYEALKRKIAGLQQHVKKVSPHLQSNADPLAHHFSYKALKQFLGNLDGDFEYITQVQDKSWVTNMLDYVQNNMDLVLRDLVQLPLLRVKGHYIMGDAVGAAKVLAERVPEIWAELMVIASKRSIDVQELVRQKWTLEHEKMAEHIRGTNLKQWINDFCVNGDTRREMKQEFERFYERYRSARDYIVSLPRIARLDNGATKDVLPAKKEANPTTTEQLPGPCPDPNGGPCVIRPFPPHGWRPPLNISQYYRPYPNYWQPHQDAPGEYVNEFGVPASFNIYKTGADYASNEQARQERYYAYPY